MNNKPVMHRRQFARLLCKYGSESVYQSHYVCIGALSLQLQLYVSDHQHESAGNGHKLAHAMGLRFLFTILNAWYTMSC